MSEFMTEIVDEYTGDNPPSLDHVETTAIPENASAYVRRLRLKDPDEWEAVCNLYHQIGNGPGTNQWDMLTRCHAYVYFAIHHQSRQVQVWGSSCKQRWCPICARNKGIRLGSQTARWIRSLRQPKFITLTQQQRDEPLTDSIDRLYANFRKLRSRKDFRDKCKSGIWFSQVTYNTGTRSWHPHLHIIADMDFVRQAKLSTLWEDVTTDSKIVDIRRINDPVSSGRYVSRYAARPAKLSSVPADRRPELYHAYQGRRLCGAWGIPREANPLQEPKLDRSEYACIDSYDVIMSQAAKDELYARIVESWINNQPLTESEYNQLQLLKSTKPAKDDHPDPPPKQRELFTYNEFSRTYNIKKDNNDDGIAVNRNGTQSTEN